MTPHTRRRRSVWRLALTAITALCSTTTAAAQNIISVPFTQGFIGTRGSSAGTANNVLTYQTLGIARTFFIQNSSTTTFELQGNDIPGTLRIVRTNGQTLDIPASANWRNSGGTTYLLGILPRPTSPITYTYSGGSITITDGSSNGGSSVGGYIAGYTGATLADGASTSGNAAQSQLLTALNAYLATVVSSRPTGPVTVTAQTTSSTTPTLAGTATVGAGEALTVVISGVQYSTSSSPAVIRSGSNWSLTLTTPLSVGTYDVAATITNSDGFTLSDATLNELVISAPVTTLTIGGTFTANSKTYDGTTAATGNTAGLTLIGVNGGDNVTIASATLAFGTAAAGDGKSVSITAITLGGTNASNYTVSLAGAPTATAAISQRAATISGVSITPKTYDGTLTATLSGTASYGNLAPSESFSVSGTPAATFTTPGIGTNKPVTVTGYTAPSANYTITQPTGLTGNITARQLTIGGSFTVANRPFDGTTTAALATNALTLTPVVTNDTVTLTAVTAAFADAAVGVAKTVSLTAATLGGVSAGNYTLSLAGAPTTTADITALSTTVTIGGTFSADDKTYDGTTAATGNTAGLTLIGVNGGDNVTIASATLAFNTAAAGSGKTVSITAITLGGTNGSSYTVNLAGAPTTTATISQRAATISGVSIAPKTYDGTLTATLTGTPAYGNLAPSESFSVSGTPVATFATPGIGTAKPVTVTGYTAPSANYTITQPTGLTANITARQLTIGGSFTVANRPFDGTTTAALATNALTLTPLVTNDTVTLTGVTAAFADAAVGTAKTVSITGGTLGGVSAGNYTLSLAGAPTTTADITALSTTVTIGGTFTANDKVFDGTATATGTVTGLTLAGKNPSDDVSIAAVTLVFPSAAVGAGQSVSISSVTLAGADASRYAVSLAGAPTATASILAADPPSAPRTVAAAPGDSSAIITWAAPLTAGCSAIRSYAIETSRDGTTTWTRQVVTAPSGSLTVSSLSNNVPYRVRVFATNDCGTSEASTIVSFAPVAVTKEVAGAPRTNPAGTATTTINGTVTPVVTEVVGDSAIVIGQTGTFGLSLQVVDSASVPIPVDSTRILSFEQGSNAMVSGRGLKPGTVATLYFYSNGNPSQPALLAQVTIGAGGTFDVSSAISPSTPPGMYTVQINGIDNTDVLRSVALGVEVTEPPPDLTLTSTPDKLAPVPGDTVQITLRVANTGPGPAIDVVIPRAFTEPGFRILTAVPLQGTYDGASVTWRIPRINAGATALMQITAVVTEPVSPPTPRSIP